MNRTLKIGSLKRIIPVGFLFLLLMSWVSVGYSEEISRPVAYRAEQKPLGDGINWNTSIPQDFDPLFLQFRFVVDPGRLTSEIHGDIIFDQENQTLSVKPRRIVREGNFFAGKLETSGGVLLSGAMVYDFKVRIPFFAFSATATISGRASIPGFPQIDEGWHSEAFFNTFLLGTDESVEVKAGVRELVSVEVTAVEIAEHLATALSQGSLPQIIADKAGKILKKYIGDGGITINGGLESRFVLSGLGIDVDGQLITREGQTVSASGLDPALNAYSISSSFEESLSVGLDFISSGDIFLKFAPFDIEMWSYKKEIVNFPITLVPDTRIDVFDFTTSPASIIFPVQSRDVTDPNRSPIAVGSIANQTLQAGRASAPIHIPSKFNDPDNDTLTYTSRSSNSVVATAQIAGPQATIYASNVGSTTITITATDPEGLQAAHTFTVTVQPSTAPVNRPPAAIIVIGSRRLSDGGASSTIDVSNYFSDPDGDSLVYNATSNNSGVVTAEVLNNARVRITPESNGQTTVTVTASDGELTATQTFTVTVSAKLIRRNRPPIAQGTISPQVLTVGSSSKTLDISGYFYDLDGDTLTYTVTPSDENVVRAQRTGASSVRLTPMGEGNVTVTVTASDRSLSVTQTFSVSVDPGDGDISDSPDVVVENISADYVNNYPGERYTVFATVRNAGGRSASKVRLRYYLSDDATYSTDDEEYEGLADYVGSLESGEMSHELIRLDAPSKQGSYYIIAHVASVENERNTSNNYASIKITVLPPATPDLVVTLTARSIAARYGTIDRLTARSYLIDSNSYFRLIANVRNQGREDTPDSSTVRYYFSTDAIISSDDVQFAIYRTGRFGAGESDQEKTGLRAPKKPGDYYYYAYVDSVEGEDNTDNNYSDVIKVSVRGPDLVIDSVSVVSPNGLLRLHATVLNQGTDEGSSSTLRYYISSDAILSDDDTEFDTDSVHALDPNEKADKQSKTTPVNYVSGVFYCFVCIDDLRNELDTTNNCSEPIEIRVRNVAPRANGQIPPQTLNVGTPISLDVSAYFTDANNDTLTYSVSSDNPAVATVRVSTAQVIITPEAAGSTIITVVADDNSANDGSSTATQKIAVTVTVPVKNRPPTAEGSISAQTLSVGDSSVGVNVAGNFIDPDNDPLTYTVSSDNPAVATVSVSGAQVTITPEAAGSTTIRVTASDGNLIAIQEIAVTVSTASTAPVENNAPTTVGSIPVQTLSVGDSSVGVNVAGNFIDPDNDPLTYTVSSDNPAVATVSVSGAQVTITPEAAGSTTIRVTASDGNLIAIQEIAVTVSTTSTAPVENNAPTTVGSIPVQTLSVGDSSVGVNVAGNFIDPDNDPLTYAVSSNDPAVATVSVSGAQVTITPEAAGSTTIAVTASDGSLTATQTISVSVVSSTDTDKEAWIPDENLRTAVRSALGLQAGDALTQQKMTTLTELTARSSQIASLTGLEYATNLSVLILDFNSVSDLTPLAGLTALKGISLHENSVSDLTPLAGLTALRVLTLNYNSVSDLTPLAGLTALAALSLFENSVSDLTPLAGLTALEFLLLILNSISDATPLAGLTALKYLAIAGNPITDLAPLQSLKANNSNMYIDVFDGLPPTNLGDLFDDDLFDAAAPNLPVNPAKTTLLPNYPNPFNPETWIPYQLAKPADVTLTIYNVRGVMVRQLALGHRAAGVYYSRTRAAHWDGKNNLGEKVAAGLYFCTLRAGDFTATRKMLIRK